MYTSDKPQSKLLLVPDEVGINYTGCSPHCLQMVRKHHKMTQVLPLRTVARAPQAFAHLTDECLKAGSISASRHEGLKPALTPGRDSSMG